MYNAVCVCDQLTWTPTSWRQWRVLTGLDYNKVDFVATRYSVSCVQWWTKVN